MGLAESIRETYQRAAREVDKKTKDFWARHKAKAEKKLQDVASGKISMDDYQRWLSGQVFIGDRWKEKLDDITRTYVEADEKAREIINKTDKNVFVRFANAQGRDIKSHIAGYSFDLYDKHTVERLLKEDPKMLPEWKIDEPKDYTWNEKRVKNEIMQGIIQGEDIPSIAKRLSDGLATSNHKKMNMFARTAVTGAQNAGRMERLHEAQDMGVVVKKKWLAAHDDRVRDAHAYLDGQTVEVDEPFVTEDGQEIMFPGDPSAAPELVYNCRCTLVYVYDVKASAENLKESSNALDQSDEQQMYEQNTQKQEMQNAVTMPWEDKEIEALRKYTSSSYSGINSLLREGSINNYPDAEAIVKQIDKAMSRSKVADGTVTSRGATTGDLSSLFSGHKRSWFEDARNLRSLEGETSSFDWYISTTKGEQVAQPYKNGVEWHFVTDGDVSGIDMRPFASSNIRDVEDEILFNRGTRVEIMKIEVDEDEEGYVAGTIKIWAKLKRGK